MYLSIPTIDTDKYDVIKSTLLGRVGITSFSRLQHLLKFSPMHEESTAQYYGTAVDILRPMSKDLTLEQFLDKLGLEFTYHALQPHISSFVRSLRCPKVHECIEDIDQYVISREIPFDELWQCHNKPKQSWTPKQNTSTSSTPAPTPNSTSLLQRSILTGNL